MGSRSLIQREASSLGFGSGEQQSHSGSSPPPHPSDWMMFLANTINNNTATNARNMNNHPTTNQQGNNGNIENMHRINVAPNLSWDSHRWPRHTGGHSTLYGNTLLPCPVCQELHHLSELSFHLMIHHMNFGEFWRTVARLRNIQTMTYGYGYGYGCPTLNNFPYDVNATATQNQGFPSPMVNFVPVVSPLPLPSILPNFQHVPYANLPCAMINYVPVHVPSLPRPFVQPQFDLAQLLFGFGNHDHPMNPMNNDPRTSRNEGNERSERNERTERSSERTERSERNEDNPVGSVGVTFPRDSRRERNEPRENISNNNDPSNIISNLLRETLPNLFSNDVGPTTHVLHFDINNNDDTHEAVMVMSPNVESYEGNLAITELLGGVSRGVRNIDEVTSEFSLSAYLVDIGNRGIDAGHCPICLCPFRSLPMQVQHQHLSDQRTNETPGQNHLGARRRRNDVNYHDQVDENTDPHGTREHDDDSLSSTRNLDGLRMRKTLCGHVFCSDCLKLWLERSVKCPVCNLDLEELRASTPSIRSNRRSSGRARGTRRNVTTRPPREIISTSSVQQEEIPQGGSSRGRCRRPRRRTEERERE